MIATDRVFIGLGSNLASPHHGPPIHVLEAAVDALRGMGQMIVARSRWYRSAPWPPSDQPWYVNGVVEVAPLSQPAWLLEQLHVIEAEFGRIRRDRNEARVLDLDLLAYGNRIIDEPGALRLPHPRLHERAFVLAPMAELAPTWDHPILGETVAGLMRRVADTQKIELCEPL